MAIRARVFVAEVGSVSRVVDVPVSKDHEREVARSTSGTIQGFLQRSTLEGKAGIDQDKPAVAPPEGSSWCAFPE